MKQEYIDLKMPSIMGMGAVGPTLSVLTASLYSALIVVTGEPPHWAYPVIMLSLSGLMAVFPTIKSNHKLVLKIALWPIVTVIVFSAAWGANHGLSLGEDVVSKGIADFTMPSLVSSAYAGPTNKINVTHTAKATKNAKKNPWLKSGAKINAVNFSKVDYSTKLKLAGSFSPPSNMWGLTVGDSIYLKDADGKWCQYEAREDIKKTQREVIQAKPSSAPPQSQRPLGGGFFKRWRK